VRNDVEVRVFDYATDKDISAQMLAQVISTREKKGSRPAPLEVLLRLIQAGDRGLQNLEEMLLAFKNPIPYVDNEIRQRLQTLANEKTLTNEQYAWLADLLLDPRWEENFKTSLAQEDAVRDEFVLLMQKIAALEDEIRDLQGET